MSGYNLSGAHAGTERSRKREHRRVIIGASLGTLFEWYDFLIYGSLTPFISRQFFAGVNPTAAYIFTLLAFSAGFFIRPLGAVIFGRIGDLAGRKFTFLVTMTMMGGMTFLIGLLPNYETIGIAAPAILIILRLLQGLALGGEYGGAATYVSEYAPALRRGAYTSLIQVTATGGLLLALVVFIGCRALIDPSAFEAWGWRVPFLLSIVLVAVSVWIRITLRESPAFEKMKREGRLSSAPIFESFGKWNNLKIVLLAFCLSAGPAVIWAASQFYSLFFITQTLKVDPTLTSELLVIALILAAPFFFFFGWLSDFIGRKPVVLAGLLIATATYIPMFKALTHYANPALETAMAQAPVVVIADPAQCALQFNPVGTAKFVSSCDVAKSSLVQRTLLQRGCGNRGQCADPRRINRDSELSRERRGCEISECRFHGLARTDVEGRRLSSEGGSATGEQADAGFAALCLDRLCRDCLRSAHGATGRIVSDPHSLHVLFSSVSHRQRLVRWVRASRRIRDTGKDGQSL
jgi:MFS family permease